MDRIHLCCTPEGISSLFHKGFGQAERAAPVTPHASLEALRIYFFKYGCGLSFGLDDG